VRQVVHHVADSHMNALIRLKLALTEDSPRSNRTTRVHHVAHVATLRRRERW
jgi:hypothetical protein